MMAKGNRTAQPKRLFPLGDASDAADYRYRYLRSDDSPDACAGRLFAERLWSQYSPYADKHFLVEIMRDFHARFWEMYLTCALLENAPAHGFSIDCPKPTGPDIVLSLNGRRVWIEAVTVTNGDPEKPDSVIEPNPDPKSTFPEQKIILRYTNAITEKHNKYLKYCENGVVADDDAYIVAVNGFPLSYQWADAEMPRVLKAVFPIGALQFLLDKETSKITSTRHEFRPSIPKSTGKEVSTEIFANEHYRGISAIVHSYANACMGLPMGSDFLVIHNPYAAQPVARGLIVADREYWVEELGGKKELVCHHGQLTR
jgi:hypothetical protein